MPFPDIVEKDFSVGGKKNLQVHEALDYAANQWNSRDSRVKRINSLYDSHNGITAQDEIDAVTKSTGRLSKTKYIQYRLGRTKLKQLHGEFLEINIEPTVHTTNRDALNRKMEKYKTQLGMALAKPQIEKVRSMGYDVFSGIKIPDRDDKNAWNAKNFKLTNELVMQCIVDDKMKTQRLKSIFYYNFVDGTITSEMFGKVERNINGIDTFRFIPAKYTLYEESISDTFLEQSPYLGEVRPMFYHEILTSKEFDLDEEDRKLVKDLASTGNSTENKNQQNSGGMGLINTYTIQWKGLEPVYVKISPAEGSDEPYMRIVSEQYYNKNKKQIDRQVRDGEFTIEKYLREILWTASRIHTGIYTKAKKETNLIQRLNENNKYNVDFDYSGMLLSTVDGVRVSIQEIIKELEKIYDAIRFQINRELKKIKGTMVAFDEAFTPKGQNISDVIHSITEDGLVRFNSSAEGNVSGMELESNKVGIQAINLGNNQNLLVLLQQAIDIERVMDRVTGMNEGRQGLQKATTTATANVNNIEASRSMTYDLFYFMQEFIERTLTKLAEKTKINKTYIGADQRQFIFDDGEEMFMMSTRELDADNYGITITDGKKEKDILNKMEMLFPQEINAGNLRSADAGKFWAESSFAAALRVLDNAHEQLANIRQQDIRVKQESAMKSMEQQVQQVIEDREDTQQHDLDMETLRTEGKKEVLVLEKSLSAQNDTAKIAGKAATTAPKQNKGIL
jgi:hypothetical protein